MGVLHVALVPSPRFPLPPRPAVQPSAKGSPRRSPGGVADGGGLLTRSAPEPRPGTAVPRPAAEARGTLEPHPPSAEAQLQRTPEQIAEQEALAKLVRRCLGGDAEAWQQLVVAQNRRVYGICYRFTGSKNDAEDLTQEVFLKVYRNLASFDVAKGSFQTWISTLTRNLLVDHFRRTRMDRATDSLQASFDGEPDSPTMADQLMDTRPDQMHHVAAAQLRVRVQDALKELSPELREAVILRDLEDMDYKEIAQVLRIPEGTVKSRISRGRGELARLLGRIEGQVV